MKTPKYFSILSLAVIGALYGASPAWAAPILGTAQSFAVPGCLDGDQHRPDHHLGRSGCLPRHFDHWRPAAYYPHRNGTPN